MTCVFLVCCRSCRASLRAFASEDVRCGAIYGYRVLVAMACAVLYGMCLKVSLVSLVLVHRTVLLRTVYVLQFRSVLPLGMGKV